MPEEKIEKKVVSIKIDEESKSRMENHPEMNWSEIIRTAIQRKLSIIENDKSNIEDFFKDPEIGWLPRWILHMMVSITNKQSLRETVNIITGSDTQIILKIEKDLLDIGFSIDDYKNRNEIQMEMDDDPEFIEMIGKRITEKMKEAPGNIKDGIWLLMRYVNDDGRNESVSIQPEGLNRSYQILTSSTDDIGDELVRMGFLYKDYYDSNAYSHPLYRIPKYIFELGYFRSQPTEPSEIKKLLHDQKIMEFIKVVGRKKLIAEFNENEIIKKESKGKLNDDDIEKVRYELIRSGILVLDYYPHRRRVGKRKSDPPYWIYRLTKNTFIALGEYVVENYGES